METTYGDFLVPIILEKLPGNVRQQIAREHGDKDWKLAELRQALLKEIEALQAGSNDEPERNTFAETPCTTAFYTDTRRTSPPQGTTHPRKPRTCAYCKGPHYHNDCVIVIDRKKHHDIAKRDRLCFNCLGRHRASECKSKGKCGWKHHTSLCSSSETKQVTPPKKSEENTEPTSTPSQTASHTHVYFARTKTTENSQNGPVLLKTAVAPVSTDSDTVNATILFDEGATRSFITHDLANKLNLKPNNSELVNLTTFGEKGPQMRSFDVTNITLQTLDGPRTISALIVPKISAPITNLISRSLLNQPHLRGLQFAHPISNVDSFEISVLIGADCYWEFVEDRVIRGNGPTAVMSKFGYLLSGPTSQTTLNSNTTMLHVAANTCEEESKLQSYWDLETIGINEANADINAKEIEFETSRDTHLSVKNGKYVAKLFCARECDLASLDIKLSV
ncbi:uncharacterized protein LOC144450649 [Glandiceps talaboti]